MIVRNNEIGWVGFQHEISIMNRIGVESNGCKEIYSSVKEHRILKRIKMIINKFLNCIFCKKVEGPWPPGPPPVIGGPAK